MIIENEKKRERHEQNNYYIYLNDYNAEYLSLGVI